MKVTALPIDATEMMNVACDVGSARLNLVCTALSRPGSPAEWEIPNRTASILETLAHIHSLAIEGGARQLRIIVEPTGVYHRLLLELAAQMGFATCLVDASHVAKMRAILFGDRGKTDQRDPYAIEAVVAQRPAMVDRRLGEPWRLLRQWNKLYSDAEGQMIDAKSRIHRMLHLLFPDFDFGTDFLYGPSGRAIFRCFGLNPHRIASQSPARLRERLLKSSRIQGASVDRLLAHARASVTNVKPARVIELLEHEMALAWEDLELQEARRQKARTHIETLYDEIRTEDPRLPSAQPGVISKTALARLFAEVGPLGDYHSWRQVLRMGGLNLCERKSGKYVGQTKISRTGRSSIRVILNQIALPLVKRDRLFGPYYHHKIGVQKMSGKKAMTAVARKIVKMIWGWYHSAAAFDPARVFHCESDYRRAA